MNPTLICACKTPIGTVSPRSSCRWGDQIQLPGTQALQQTLRCEIGHGGCFWFLEERFQPRF